MKLERIELRHLSLPLRFPFVTSFGRTTRKEFLLLSVKADGVTGHGECVADADPSYLPETNGTVAHVIESFLAPLAFDWEVGDPRGFFPALGHVRGHPMAKAALEMAVWDLAARRAGRPLYALVGGRGGSIASGVSVGLQESEAALLAKVEAEVAAGYRRIKIKIAPGHDLKLVDAVRARFPEIPLMVDANSAYTLADGKRLRSLDQHRLMMIEQPLGWDDLQDHATLQRELQTPICLDESIGSLAAARLALAIEACRIINIKPGRVGGIGPTIAIHDLCRRQRIPVWCGGMLESGIGRLANVHIQTLPGFTLPGDTSASARYFEEDLVDPPVTVSAQGEIGVPEGPGIGHQILWSRVERATTWRRELRPD